MFCLFCSYSIESLSLGYFRHPLFHFLIRIYDCHAILIFEAVFKEFPSILQDNLSFCFEDFFLAFHFNLCLLVNVILTHCHDRMDCNQEKNLFFPGFQFIQMAGCKFHRWNDCMVICHLAVIHDFLHIWLLRLIKRTCQLIFLINLTNHISCGLLHIFGQILAVRSWISDQFLFIQALSGIQCLFGCHSIDTVCFSLQCGQVIKFWCFYFLFRFFYCCDNSFTSLASTS